MSQETEAKEAPVGVKKEDILIWIPGKSLEEMKAYEVQIVDALKEVVSELAFKKSVFNSAYIYSGLIEKGFEVAHPFIKKLLAEKLHLRNSAAGENSYDSEQVKKLFKLDAKPEPVESKPEEEAPPAE
jgi:hypothetical protein